MAEKSQFEENLGALTTEQFERVKSAITAETDRRVSPADFRKKVSEMTTSQLDHLFDGK